MGIKSKHKKTKRRQKRFSRNPEEKQKYKLQPTKTQKQTRKQIKHFLPTLKTHKRRHHKKPKHRRSYKLDPRAEIRRKLLLKYT